MEEARSVKINKKTLRELALQYIDIPEDKHNDSMFICWHIEEAYYHYLDVLLPDRSLGLRFCSFNVFAAQLIKFCPFLKTRITNCDGTLEQYKKFRKQSRRCGAVLFTKDKSRVLLVREKMKIPVYQQGKGGKELVPVYSFPFGKLDPDEDAATCAARKVEEETGYQIQGHFDPNKFFEAKIGRDDYERMVQLFIVKDVPEETIFKAKRTGEIAGHEWFLFKHLLAIKKDPSKTAYNEKSFTGVFPFLQQIKNWLDEEAMQK